MLGAQDREIIQTPLPSSCSLHKGGKSTVSGVVKGPMTRTHVSGKCSEKSDVGVGGKTWGKVLNRTGSRSLVCVLSVSHLCTCLYQSIFNL